MDKNNKFLIKDITLINPNEEKKKVDVYIEGKKISEIGKNLNRNCKIIDGRDKFLIPGLIDIHIQGAGGTDFVNFEDEENIEKITLSLPSFGTTLILATTVFMPCLKEQKHIEKIIKKIEKIKGTKILGIHLEGPYINVKRKGMIREEEICSPKERYIEEIIEICDGKLKMMTLAPEIEGIKDIIKKLFKNNIIPSIGHTDATFDETKEIINIGVNHVTHFLML